LSSCPRNWPPAQRRWVPVSWPGRSLAGGYSIIYVIDKRQVLTADARDSILSLKQVSITFPKGTAEKDAAAKAAEFAKVVKAIHGCGQVDAAAADRRQRRCQRPDPRARPSRRAAGYRAEACRRRSDAPFGSIEDGVRVLMLCGRDDPKVENGPSFEQLQSQIEDDRVNKRAQTYLRDLRRDAVIEYN
jgi:peptidyl-prolyl cis-trans isomerase SurA